MIDTAAHTDGRTAGGGGLLWPWSIFALLGLNMAICAVTIFAATRHPEARAVEPDYYQRSLDWDANRQQWHTPEQMGMLTRESIVRHAGRGRIVVQVRGNIESGKLQGEAFHRAKADERFSIVLLRTGQDASGWNTYEARLPSDRAGLWVFRMEEPASGIRFERVVEYAGQVAAESEGR